MVRRTLWSRLVSRIRPTPVTATVGEGASVSTLETEGGAAGERSASGPDRMQSATSTARGSGAATAGAEPRSRVSVEQVSIERFSDDASEGAPRSDGDRLKASKLKPQEELSLKITEGLTTLTGLLSTIDHKLADQNEIGRQVSKQLETLPDALGGVAAAQRQNLDMLREVKEVLHHQGVTSRHTAERLGELNPMVEGIGRTLEEQTRSGEEVRRSVENVGQQVRGLVDSSHRAQSSLVSEFRRTQEEHRRRLDEMVERERRSLFVVAGIGLVVVVCLLIMLTK